MRRPDACSRENRRLIPELDVQEWIDAVAEYRDRGRPRATSHQVRKRDLGNQLAKATQLLGSFLQRTETSLATTPPTHEGFVKIFAVFSLARCTKTLKAVQMLLDENYPEQAAACARGIYESYLRIVYASANAKNAAAFFASYLGIHIGTHRYALTKSGRVKFKLCVDVQTGEVHEAGVSATRMAAASPLEEDPDLHEVLYDFMSSFAHPYMRHADSYLEAVRFSPRVTIERADVDLTVLFSVVVLLDWVVPLVDTTSQLRRDVRRFLKSSVTLLLRILKRSPPEAEDVAELLRKRLSRIRGAG